jgi:muramoyltetrapeptide carboxypeptidase
MSIKKNILKRGSQWEPLKPGDTVDIIAPGFSVTEDRLKGAIEFVKHLGLVPRVPKDIFGADILCSQTDEVRLKHLVAALNAKDSKAVWCLRGGYGSVRLIEAFSKIKKPKKNKLFIGYSDITTIHNYLNQFFKFSTIHGPLLDRLGHDYTHFYRDHKPAKAVISESGQVVPPIPKEQVDEFKNLIFGKTDKIIFRGLKPLNKAAQKKAVIKASVVGGSLTVTQNHLGTKFARTPDGQILFFEDIGERGYKVDRMLQQMKQAGYFKSVKAIVFGEFYLCDEPNGGPSLVPQVLARFASEMKFPVFSGVEAGHGANQRAVPLFTRAELYCSGAGELHIQSGSQKVKK